MGFYQSDNQGNTDLQKTAPELLAQFNDPLDCLTAHLMLECSEVIAGVKPANLVSLVNRTRPCGRNLYQLWQDHQQQIARRLGKLEFIVLQTKPKALLLLCFNRKQLKQQLSHAGIRTLLHKAGYKPQACLDELLDLLTQRIIEHDRFPHEIGLFIGYPPKDVAAFMGLVKLPFTCQALWKIYGNPAHSLRLADDYRCCRQRMGAILATGNRQMLEIKDPEHPFFRQNNDIDFQLL
ncbi:MAG: DUF3793 family protein [Geobacteraceae bacterium]|nr:DUF3793 family protein [Geobacteraceae bacterium]